MDRVVRVLLILSVGLIGADRINLLAGAGGFLLTPFLVLTPVVLVAALLAAHASGRGIRVPREAPLYFLVVGALLATVAISALLSQDPVLSGRRTVLLIAQVVGSMLIALLLINRERGDRILVQGAYLGLAIATVFNLLQVYYWLGGGWEPGRPESDMLFNLAPRTYGGIVPRLSGQVIDQGRAGLLFVTYLYILVRFAAPSRLRSLMIFVGVVSVVGTLARSAALCAVVAAGLYWIHAGGVRLTWRRIFATGLAGATVTAFLLAAPGRIGTALDQLEPLGGRFSFQEGSFRMHMELIEHGLVVATSSLHNVFFGIGYGNALMVLEDFFPGDPYANFHSLYVTLLAESGVFALALGIWLLAYPLLRRWGPFVPLLGGAAAYNVFYQSTTDPNFWLVVALAWLTVGAAGSGRITARAPTSSPATAIPGVRAPAPAIPRAAWGAGAAILLGTGCGEILIDDYRYGHVEVEAARRSGSPVAGVELVLHRGGQHLAYGRTGADGRHRFDRVPFGKLGLFVTLPEGYTTRDFNGWLSLDEIELSEGQAHSLLLPPLLREGSGSVRLRLSSDHEEVLGDVQVELYSPAGRIRQGVTSGEGVAEFDSVPFGTYGILTHVPRGYLGDPNSPFALVDGILVDDGSLETVSVVLERCQGRVRATVREPGGRAVAGARLVVYRWDGELAQLDSDEEGLAHFERVPCGDVGVAVAAPLGFVATPGRGGSFVDGLTIASDGDSVEASFQLQPCLGRVRVRVIDELGAPVAGAGVDLYTAAGVVAQRVSDGSGDALFDRAPCAELGVSVAPPPGYRAEAVRGSGFMDGLVVRDGDALEVTLRLVRS